MTPLTAEQLAAPVSAALLGRIVRFGHALRAAGLDANPGRVADFTAALGAIDLRRRDDFYYAARATLLSRPDQRDPFDEIFARFWPAGRLPLDASDPGAQGAPEMQPALQQGEEGEPGEGEGGEQRTVAGAAAAGQEQDSQESPEDSQAPGTAVMRYSAQE